MISPTLWKGTIAYDGTDWCGWQRQPSGNTLQDCLEGRLKQLFQSPIKTYGSGRTDAGVHALGQVFHFCAAWKHGPESLMQALNAGLPPSLLVQSIEVAPPGFHARYSAYGKRYAYHLYEGRALPLEARTCWSLGQRKERLNCDAMRAAATLLIGEHDFSAFSANPGNASSENPVKHLYCVEIQQKEPRMKILYEGSGFLYKMVRTLTGALVQVGLGRLTPTHIAALLQNRKRTSLTPTAPACGLILEKVFYKKPPNASCQSQKKM